MCFIIKQIRKTIEKASKKFKQNSYFIIEEHKVKFSDIKNDKVNFIVLFRSYKVGRRVSQIVPITKIENPKEFISKHAL